MLHVDLAALSVNDLRRLLEVARGRGQGALAASLRSELDARRSRPPTWTPARLQFERDLEPIPSSPPRPARRRGPALPVLAATALLSLGLGWGMSPPARWRTEVAQPPARIMLAKTAPASIQPIASAGPGPETAAVPPETEAVATPEIAAAAPRPANPCLKLPTPGERLVCGYPSLAIQDRRMQAALDRAMSSAADPDAVRRAQAAWHAASDRVSDRGQLSDLYARRIGELEAGSLHSPANPSPG